MPKPSPKPEPTRDRFFDWLLGGLVALPVAGVLLPADSVAALLGAGLPLVALTLLLAIVWLGRSVVQKRTLVVRFGQVEWSVVGLLAWHSLAALVAARYGAPRPALNLLWQWVGFGAWFLLARQLLSTPRQCRAVLAVMLSLCVLQSAYGFWRRDVETPTDWKEYEKTKVPQAGTVLPGQGTLMDAAMQHSFEARLYSPEPLGSFGLTNSLAGLLAAWIVVGIGVAWSVVAARPLRWPSLIALAALAVGLCLIGVCLAATHSRTAQLAAVAGVAVLGVTRGGTRLPRRAAWIAAALALALVAAVILIWKSDLTWLAGAKRSLVFRFEYWQSTWRMICENPWLGCGPGNFREHYTQFMLPQASEAVADPHNMILELWASAGTPAVVALLAIGTAFWWRILKYQPQPSQAANDPQSNDARWTAELPIALGAIAGIVLAYLLGLYFDPVVAMSYKFRVFRAGVVIMAGVLAAIWPWVRNGRVTPLLPAVGAGVLAVNLLAAGGISFPGVAGSLWLLMAVGLTLADMPGAGRILPRSGAIGALVLLLILMGLCEYTGLSPVMHSQMALDEAVTAGKQGDGARREALLREAAAADPLTDQPLRGLAELKLLAWRDAPSDARFAEFEAATQKWLARLPHSAAAAMNVGNWYLAAYRIAPNPQRIAKQRIEKSAEYYRLAQSFHPQSNVIAAHLAWAEHLAGDETQAARDAATALRLDALNPHADRQLSGSLVRLADPDPRISRAVPAELMRQLTRQSGGDNGQQAR
ncbi:MAG: O-antigen ligase family protein [Planctomycetia bacterium]|nr:O-antigen ligase family protein [Planctomycetia bacterium]